MNNIIQKKTPKVSEFCILILIVSGVQCGSF